MPWPLHRSTHSPVDSALGSLSSLGRGRCCSRGLRCSSSGLLLVVSHSGKSSRMLSSPSVGQEFPSRGCHCLNSPITALEVLNSILLFTFGSSTGAQTVTTHKARCQQGRCPRIICWWNIYFRETYRARSKRQMTSSSYPPPTPSGLSLWGSGLGEVSGPVGGAGGLGWGWLGLAGVLAQSRGCPVCAASPGRYTESAESFGPRPGWERRPLHPRMGRGCPLAPTSIVSSSLGSRHMCCRDGQHPSPAHSQA